MLTKLALAAVTLVLAALFATAYEVGRVGLAGYLQASPSPPLAGGPTAALGQRLGQVAGVERPVDEAIQLRDQGLVALTRARATADPTYYRQAEGALTKALAARPDDPDVLVGTGALALARHEFAEALTWGERARAAAPKKAAVYGVIGDAQVELGRYDEALDTIQTMVDLKPDAASYSRVSYLRELHGDLDGAVVAMRRAADASAAGEPAAWTRLHLGHLLLREGRV